MLAPERRTEILAIVRQNKSAQVKQLSDRFAVTGETIRKDLTILEAQGHLYKTYGGAYILDGVKNQMPTALRQTIVTKAKDAIGLVCRGIVHNGDTLFLDESTTCHSIARHILDKTDLTVLTNSLRIAQLLEDAPKIKLILAGGELDPNTKSFVGQAALLTLSHYYVDKAFVSCRGFSMQSGMTDSAEQNGFIRRLMLKHAATRCLVADSTKADRTYFYKIADFDSVDTLVVDTLPNPEWAPFLAARNIELVESLKITPPAQNTP